MKKTFIILTILSSLGCKNDAELAMERGIHFYEWDRIEESVLEFKYVIHSLGSRSQKINYEEIKLLSRAHYNLAVAYAKKNWYRDAAEEARKAFELFPTDDNKKVLELIQTKVGRKTKPSMSKSDSTSR